MDAPERGPRDRADARGEHLPQRVEAEGPELEHVEPPGKERARGVQRVAPLGARAHGREQADRLAVEPPERVTQRARRGGVEPLGVVDGEDDRPRRGEPAQRRQHGAPADGRLELRVVRRRPHARVLEEVDEAAERERRLLLGGPREQHAELPLPAALDRVEPERRLADAGLAADQQRPRARGDGPHERLDASRLGFATDDLCVAARDEGGELAHRASIGRPSPAVVARGGAVVRSARRHPWRGASMALAVKDLLEMSESELDELFRRSPPGEIPDGNAEGTILVTEGPKINKLTDRIARAVAWQGKVFDREKGDLRNKVGPFRLQARPREGLQGGELVRRQGDDRPRLLEDVVRREGGPRRDPRGRAPASTSGSCSCGRDKILHFALDFDE